MYSLYSYISSFIFALLVLPSVCRCEPVRDFRASQEGFSNDCQDVETRACLTLCHVLLYSLFAIMSETKLTAF